MMKKKVGYASYRLSPLKKITTRAKLLKKKHPNAKWTALVSKASKELSSEGKIGKTPGGYKKKKRFTNPKHKGFCTPMSKKTCTPRRKHFAREAKAGVFKHAHKKVSGMQKTVGAIEHLTSNFSNSQMIGAIKKGYESQLGNLFVKREKESTKRGKKAITKKMNEVKSKLRQYR